MLHRASGTRTAAQGSSGFRELGRALPSTNREARSEGRNLIICVDKHPVVLFATHNAAIANERHGRRGWQYPPCDASGLILTADTSLRPQFVSKPTNFWLLLTQAGERSQSPPVNDRCLWPLLLIFRQLLFFQTNSRLFTGSREQEIKWLAESVWFFFFLKSLYLLCN